MYEVIQESIGQIIWSFLFEIAEFIILINLCKIWDTGNTFSETVEETAMRLLKSFSQEKNLKRESEKRLHLIT